MGDWSDYFEDFPEENPANYSGGRYIAPGSPEEPTLAMYRRFYEVNAEKVAKQQAEINSIIKNIKNHKQGIVRRKVRGSDIELLVAEKSRFPAYNPRTKF